MSTNDLCPKCGGSGYHGKEEEFLCGACNGTGKKCSCQKVKDTGSKTGNATIQDPNCPVHGDLCPKGGKHDWRWDGDDPRVKCKKCDKLKDALTGKDIEPHGSRTDGELEEIIRKFLGGYSSNSNAKADFRIQIEKWHEKKCLSRERTIRDEAYQKAWDSVKNMKPQSERFTLRKSESKYPNLKESEKVAYSFKERVLDKLAALKDKGDNESS